MVCKVCNKNIERGQRYKSPTLTSMCFCCEDCYNKYIKQKEEAKQKKKADKFKPEKGTSRRKLTDLIQSIFGEDANWALLMTQCKSIEQDYGFTDNDLRLGIKYAITYENYIPNLDYGMYQFISYIKPSQDFANQIKYSQEQDIEPDETVVVKRPSNKKVWRER